MSDAFDKWHIDGLGFDLSLHTFTVPDTGDPHDHPFSFTTHILKGSYVEEVWFYDELNEIWRSHVQDRKEGHAYDIWHNHIHSIIALPQGECTTIITPMEWIQQPSFYRFENGKAYKRQWNEIEFKLIENGQK